MSRSSLALAALVLVAGCDTGDSSTPSVVGSWNTVGYTRHVHVTAPQGGVYVDYRRPSSGRITLDGAGGETSMQMGHPPGSGVGLTGEIAGQPVRLRLLPHVAVLDVGEGADVWTSSLYLDEPPYTLDAAALTVRRLAFDTRLGPVVVEGAVVYPTVPLAAGVETEVPSFLPNGGDEGCIETHTFERDGRYHLQTGCADLPHAEPLHAVEGTWRLDGSRLLMVFDPVLDPAGRGSTEPVEIEREVAFRDGFMDLTYALDPCDDGCAASRSTDAGMPAGSLSLWRESVVYHLTAAPRRPAR